MSNLNLTDAEIVKALECCGTYKGKCTDCPAFVKVDRSNCKQVLFGAIEIINRLQAEKGIKTNNWLIRGMSNEQLEKEKIEALIDIAKKYAKAEAYKECIEKVKKLMEGWGDLEYYSEAIKAETDLDNLLKELVGENETV